MRNNLKFGSLLLFVMILCSCAESNNIEMGTRVNVDGSCSRYVEVEVDSSYYHGNLEENPFPFKMDSTWVITLTELIDSTVDEGSNDIKLSYHARATKNYSKVSDMGATFYFNDEVWDSLVPEIYFRKRFKWFYNYYEYKESFPPINTLEKVLIQDYLSEQEIGTWFGENKSLYLGKSGSEINDMLSDIEYKVNQWLNRNYYVELFDFYADHYSFFDKISVDSVAFRNSRDSIFRENFDYFKSLDDEEKIMDSLMQLYFNEEVIFDGQNQLESELDAQLETRFGFLNYFPRILDYNLMLPGKIIYTNAASLENGILRWKVDAYKFFINAYNLEAKSRKANIWAFIISGFIFLIAIGSYFIRRKGN